MCWNAVPHIIIIQLLVVVHVQTLEFTPVQVSSSGATTNWTLDPSEVSLDWYLDAHLIVNGVTEDTAVNKVQITSGSQNSTGTTFVPLSQSGLYVLTGRVTSNDSFIQATDQFNFTAPQSSSAASTQQTASSTPSHTNSHLAVAVAVPVTVSFLIVIFVLFFFIRRRKTQSQYTLTKYAYANTRPEGTYEAKRTDPENIAQESSRETETETALSLGTNTNSDLRWEVERLRSQISTIQEQIQPIIVAEPPPEYAHRYP